MAHCGQLITLRQVMKFQLSALIPRFKKFHAFVSFTSTQLRTNLNINSCRKLRMQIKSALHVKVKTIFLLLLKSKEIKKFKIKKMLFLHSMSSIQREVVFQGHLQTKN